MGDPSWRYLARERIRPRFLPTIRVSGTPAAGNIYMIGVRGHRAAGDVAVSAEQAGEVRPVRLEDAGAFAEMMNRSKRGWPWDMKSGISFTAEMARAEIEGNASMGYYVAEVEDKLVGVCEVFKSPWERESSYIGFLNVEPDYQGRKFGKRLLRRAVDRAIEEGLDRITLNTWGGNLKALPLYKKMGFFWVPETYVEMVSFLPVVLRHPMFEDFFARNPDWYGVQERDLSPEPDLLERDGIRTYEYRFKSKGREIRATADRTGKWLTGGSNPSMDVWIHPEHEVSPEGLPQRMYWEIGNRTTSPMAVTVMVRAPEGIEILRSPPGSVKVRPGGRVRLEGEYRIDPKRERKDYDEPDRIETEVIVGGKVMAFRTGVSHESALQFSYDPGHFLAHPGAKARLNVRIRNRTKLALGGTVTVAPMEGKVRISPRVHSFDVEGEGQTGFTCDLCVNDDASSSLLPIVFSPAFSDPGGGQVDGRQEILHISCVRPGETLAYMMLTGKVLQLSTDRYNLSIDLRWGGRASIRDRFSGENLLSGFGNDALGPPFWPTEFERKICEHHLEEGDGFVKATVYMKSDLHEGLTLFKVYTLRTGWPTLTVQYGLVNDHPDARRYRLRMDAAASLANPKIYMPTKYGLISERVDLGYPSWLDDAPKKPRDYAENWVAVEGSMGRPLAVGCIWPREADELRLSYTSLGELKLDMAVPARGRCLAPPIHYQVADGSWKGIREVWRKLELGSIGGKRRYLEVETRRPLSFGFENRLISTASEPARGKAFVSNLRSKEETGTLRIAAPKGWISSPSSLRFRKLHWRTRKREIAFKPPSDGGPGVYEGMLTLLTEDERRMKAFPVFHLGEGRVRIAKSRDRGRTVYRVHNPSMEYRLCPSFGGIVYGLKAGEVEFLSSSFPEERPMLAFNPWFGGISGHPGWESSRGWQEKHTARKVSRGIWRGVETVCRPGTFMKRMKGLILSTAYLMAGGSNMLRMEQEIANPTKAAMDVQFGVNIFVGMGEEADLESVVPDEAGSPYPRPRGDSPRPRYHSREGWVAVRNRKLASSLMLAGPISERGHVGMEEARGCTILNAAMRPRVGPGESTRWSWHLALCSSSLDEIARHRYIRQLGPLSEPLTDSMRGP